MSEASAGVAQGGFPHYWQATILQQRPLILPRRHYVYPCEAEEVERGALEVLIHLLPSEAAPLNDPGLCVPRVSPSRQLIDGRRLVSSLVPEPFQAPADPFLATCALGFADPLAPTAVWTCPDPHTLCAISGGYAYLIDTREPERFEQVAYRPVMAVHAVAAPGLELLLFVGNQAIVAYGAEGLQWETPRLSDEGVTVLSVADGLLHGVGWEMQTDRETPFTLDLRNGGLIL